MVEWSGALGSDITFFLSRGTAYCTGRGEIMTPIDPPFPAGTKLCIVKFNNVGLSTPAVFKALEYDKLSTLDPEGMLQSFQDHQHDLTQVPSQYFLNDLEYPAFTCVPQLETLKSELQAIPGFTAVMMSGSGTSIFCLGTPDDLPAFEQQFVRERDDLQVFFTEFINRPEDQWFTQP
jgi:4-diphosphocytidyl-2-C-methyl-D-erythritol kinase